MRLVFQVLSHLERQKYFLGKCLTYHQQQVRYIHRPAKVRAVPPSDQKCSNPPSKKSFWRIFGKKENKCAEEKIETPDCEKTPRLVPEKKIEQDLANLSGTEGKAYRTCGTAYIIQKDAAERPEVKIDPEDGILDEMLKEPSLKGQCDPMPPFESVEKRLIDMNERKLHPSYKILMGITKKPRPAQFELQRAKNSYKMRSGPIMPDEIPDHLKIDKEIFERKNIYWEFKKAMPPQQMLSRLAEMKKNERPTMQKKAEEKTKTEEKQ